MDSNVFKVFVPVPVLLFLLSGACERKAEEKPVTVDVVRPVKLRKVGGPVAGKVLRMTGETRAAKRADVAFRVSGLLIEVPVKEGEEVKKGDLLARLDPRDYQSALRDALGVLAKAQAKLEYDTVEYERYAKIKKAEPGAVSEAMLNTRRAAREVSKAEVKSAEAAVAIAKDKLSYTYLYAPFDGVIGKRYVDNYEYVTAKQPIVHLQDITELEVLLDLPELMAAPIRKTRPELFAEFTAASGRKFPLAIKEFATQADPYTQTYRVVLVMPAPEGVRILPGMTATVLIDFSKASPEEKEIVVDTLAVFADEEGKSCVWVVDPETNEVHRRTVLTEELMDSDKIKIKKGLSPGEMIAVSGVSQLREGMTVRPYGAGALGEQK